MDCFSIFGLLKPGQYDKLFCDDILVALTSRKLLVYLFNETFAKLWWTAHEPLNYNEQFVNWLGERSRILMNFVFQNIHTIVIDIVFKNIHG